MPNIGSLLREEIVRLARKEHRHQSGTTKKATAQHRRDIAALKRQVASLERQVRALARRASTSEAIAKPRGGAGASKLRFVAKGLRSHRARLGLSAAQFGQLVGVSAQSVYAWEAGKVSPRREQVERIAAIRAMGKREAALKLNGARAKRGG
jgi:DNA-binding XRE family transcriptional regulator